MDDITRAEERWIDSLTEDEPEDDGYDADYEFDCWRDSQLEEDK